MEKLSKYLYKGYLPTIGIECHVQLKTATKLFSGVDNDAREAAPNTLVSHICFGLPGSLPVLNEKVIYLASKAAFALNVKPQKESHFDRKHYFYPDLPKGYQITQFEAPIVLGGSVKIRIEGEEKNIGITRAHLEEDAGKSTHQDGKDYSLVDLNRAGTPLLEIVSEPDMHNSAEAKAYAHELYLLMKYAQVSDANMYYGNMRFDVNVSVSKDADTLGTRSETKNLNSFRSVEKAVDYEIKRQVELLDLGKAIAQETRGWNDAKQKTFSQRSKEEAHDYRYFPEPDVPPIKLEDDFISDIENQMPVMPEKWREILHGANIDNDSTELLLDAEVENTAITYLEVVQKFINSPEELKKIINWIINIEIPFRRENADIKVSQVEQRTKYYEEIYNLISAGELNSNRAKDLIEDILANQNESLNIRELATQKGYIQMSDESELVEIVRKVLAENEKAVVDLKNGEDKVIGFLVGQIMKQSQGKANPALAQKIIRQQINS